MEHMGITDNGVMEDHFATQDVLVGLQKEMPAAALDIEN